MNRLITLLFVVGFSLALSHSASAASWVFQKSYYSHDPVTEVRIGPQASGGPYYSRVQGEFTTIGLRHVRSQINVRGVVFDQYNVWDSWIQTGAQF